MQLDLDVGGDVKDKSRQEPVVVKLDGEAGCWLGRIIAHLD